jgi:hypothetical protein
MTPDVYGFQSKRAAREGTQRIHADYTHRDAALHEPRASNESPVIPL